MSDILPYDATPGSHMSFGAVLSHAIVILIGVAVGCVIGIFIGMVTGWIEFIC